MDSGSTNDGGGHAGGKGLNGYAALADLLEKRGYAVNRARSEARLDDPGLLVLTPPLQGDAEDLNRIIEKRRHSGPTLLVLPKWVTMPATAATGQAKAKKGWVQIGGAERPDWASDVKVLAGSTSRSMPCTANRRAGMALAAMAHWRLPARRSRCPRAA